MSGIYRGPGGTGDATGDAASQAALAVQKAAQASSSADSASASASAAATSATNAATSATDAASSASGASSDASTASTAATNASNSATDASDSATAAASSATDAASSATAAASSASAASTSASSASSSASAASTSASNASNSATAADTSADAAAASADLAAMFTEKLLSVTDFGAIGDGVTDDTLALTNALAYASGRVLDGGGLTYKINSAIVSTSQNILVQNLSIDASSMTTGGVVLTFSGSQGSATNLSADALKGSNVLTVTSTIGFYADTYAYLTSTAQFWPAGGGILGQIVKIKSVDSSTQITVYDDVLYDFTIAASASLAPLAVKKDIELRNVRFIGANTGIQTAVKFSNCADVRVDGCDFLYIDYVSVSLDRCINSAVENCSVRYARSTGLAYGFAIVNGCYSVSINNCYGEDTRHLVTVGDNDGVNLFIRVTGCHSASARDAGIDAHPMCDHMVIDGNTVELVGGQTVDGIIFQGLNCVISNNIVVGNIATGIRHQMLPAFGSGSCVIDGNNIVNQGETSATDTCITTANETTGTATHDGVVISNNKLHGALEQGIFVYALQGNIKNVTIVGNVTANISSIYACLLRAASGFSIEDFTITGNVFKTSGVSNVYCLGTAANILNGVISGNTIKGGTNGIRLLQTQNVVETGNYNTGTTRKVFVDTGSSNATLDRRQSSTVTITNATYIVAEQDEYLIANRAGTITVTLPSASTWPGRILNIKTINSQAVVSASSNVVPITDTVAGTNILPAIDGAWGILKSDGTNWVIINQITTTILGSDINGTINGGTY